ADTQAAAAQKAETPLAAPPEVSAPSARAKPRKPKPALAQPGSPRSNQPAQPLVHASVGHEEIPTVPRSARGTIHGHIKVAVLVIVDRSGNVIDALVQTPGPSWFFARSEGEAVR